MLAIISLAVLLRKAAILKKEDNRFFIRVVLQITLPALFSFEEIRYKMQIIKIIS